MDRNLLLWLNHDASSPGLDILFAWLSQTTWFSIPLFVLILAVLARAYGKDGAKLWFTLVAVTILGDQLGGLLKYLIGQPRPCAELPELVHVPHTWFAINCSTHLNGMPSNHAWNFFAATVFLGVVLRSWTWALALGAVAAGVSLSRIYLGVHYPSQVATGMLLGALYGLLAARIALHYAPFIARLRLPAQKTP